MKPLKLQDIKLGDVVVFIDRSLNVGDCYVPSPRSSVPLDGLVGAVVRIDARTDHGASCASKKPVAEDEEHEACNCGYSPGKQLTVVLKDPHPLAHACDGFAPDFVEVEEEVEVEGEDGAKEKKKVKRRRYHGVWCRPEDLYTPSAHADHKKASAEAKKGADAADAEKKSAAAIAAKFLRGV